MAITRNFKEPIQARALRDAKFCRGLLRESIESTLAGDTEIGKMILRDYINATVGFEKLGTMVEKSPKSLLRMHSPSGNPTANNLFSIIHTLQKNEGVHFEVKTSG